MFDVVRGWIDTHLSDEEAVLFIAIVVGFFVVIITTVSYTHLTLPTNREV